MDLNASFVVFYQYDHEDRKRNLNILLSYINKNFTNVEIILVEQYRTIEDNKLGLPSICKDKNIFHTVIGELTEHYNKLQGYNFGFKFAKYENIIFNDVDIIFKPKALKKAIELINEDNDKVIHPYDGHVFGLKLNSIDSFETNLNFDLLQSYIGDYNDYSLKTDNNHIRLKNIGSTGGGLVCKKSVLYKVKGFNPNFKGWGFEDDETKLRFAKLGFPFMQLEQGNPMVHIEHREAKRSSAQLPHFFDNKAERDKVNEMTATQLIEYSSKWTI